MASRSPYLKGKLFVYVCIILSPGTLLLWLLVLPLAAASPISAASPLAAATPLAGATSLAKIFVVAAPLRALDGSASQSRSGPASQRTCKPELPTYHKIEANFLEMAFPCGFNLPEGSEILNVEISADDGEGCMNKDKKFTAFSSMPCFSCATKDLMVEVKYLDHDRLPVGTTFRVKDDAQDRQKICEKGNATPPLSSSMTVSPGLVLLSFSLFVVLVVAGIHF